MRKSVLVTAVAGLAGAVGLVASPANAVSSSSLLPAIALNVSGLSGTCVPEFVAVGIGSTGGLPYKIQGVGTATQSDTVATQVECKFHDTDTGGDIVTFKSGFTSGKAAELAQDYTVHTLDNFVTCIRVDRFDSGGVTSSTPWLTTDNQPC